MTDSRQDGGPKVTGHSVLTTDKIWVGVGNKATESTSLPSSFFSSITSLGTITVGVWHGTKIGLAYGGTNADLSATGGASQVLKQTSAGGNITVGQLAASDLSNGVSGSGAVALVTSPTFVTPTLGTAAATTINATSQLNISHASNSTSLNITSGTVVFQMYSSSGGGGGAVGTTSAHDCVFQASGTEVFRALTAGNLQLKNAANWAANGSVATSITSVGPTGANTTVQEWFKVKNAAGTTRYIPAF